MSTARLTLVGLLSSWLIAAPVAQAALYQPATRTAKTVATDYPNTTAPGGSTSYCLASTALPALKANSRVELEARTIQTGSATKTFAVYLHTAGCTPGASGTAGTLLASYSLTSTNVSARVGMGFQNRAATNSQVAAIDARESGYGLSTVAARTAAIETNVVTYLSIYGTTAASETLNLTTYSVVVYDSTGI